jgi:hypothetical protein
MYVDLTSPARAASIGYGWAEPLYVLSEDDRWTEIGSSNLTAVLVANKFENGLPVDATITGIEVFASVKAPTSSGAILSFSLTKDGVNAWGTTQTSNVLTTTASSITLGGSGYLWGLTSIPAGNIRNNNNFGVRIRQSTAGGGGVDWVRLRIHFTSNSSYLSGSRSVFPVDYDENNIQIALNGTSADQQVRAEAANLLGDCLYNIERVALHEGNDISLIGPPGKVGLVLSVTVSGSAAPGNYMKWERAFNISRSRTLVDREATAGIDFQETLKYTVRPHWNATFNFVSAIGWIYEPTSITPLHVSPKAYMMRYDNIYDSLFLGFTAVKLAALDNIQPYYNDNYKGAGLTFGSLTGTGDFVIKMIAIGE